MALWGEQPLFIHLNLFKTYGYVPRLNAEKQPNAQIEKMLGVLQGHSKTKIETTVTTNKISDTKRVLQDLSSHKRLLLQLDARIAAKKQLAIQVRSTPTRNKMATIMR